MGRLTEKLLNKNIIQSQQQPQIQYPEPPIPSPPQYIPEEEILEQQRAIHPDEYYEQYPSQQEYQQPRVSLPEPDYQQRAEQEERSPLSILEEINENPSEKGTHAVKIGGRPIDLHILEDYVVKISPYSLRTILRYHNARTIEEMKGYSKGVGMKMNSTAIILIILALGLGIVGVLVFTMFPDLMQGFAGGMP